AARHGTWSGRPVRAGHRERQRIQDSAALARRRPRPFSARRPRAHYWRCDPAAWRTGGGRRREVWSAQCVRSTGTDGFSRMYLTTSLLMEATVLNQRRTWKPIFAGILAAFLSLCAGAAAADVVTDWNNNVVGLT